MSVSLRGATSADVPYLVDLLGSEDVAPFLAAVRAFTEEAVAEEIERSEREPEAFGVLIFEVDGEAVGTATWERVNRRSRIASVGGFAIDPASGGRASASRPPGRSSVTCSATSASIGSRWRSTGSTSARSGTPSAPGGSARACGVKAYWRNDEWVDGVLFGLVAEDLA